MDLKSVPVRTFSGRFSVARIDHTASEPLVWRIYFIVRPGLAVLTSKKATPAARGETERGFTNTRWALRAVGITKGGMFSANQLRAAAFRC